MTATDIGSENLAPTRDAVTRLFARKRMVALGVPAVILAYLVYIFFAFDIPGLAGRAKMDNAAILVSDFVSYKTHVTRDNRDGVISYAIEGENKGTYPEGRLPDFVTEEAGRVIIDLGAGHSVTYEGTAATYDHPDYGQIRLDFVDGKVALDTGGRQIPEEMVNASSTRATISTEQGRMSMTRNRTETFVYDLGWELFFFTLDSPFSGKSAGELASLAISGDRIDPARSNVSLMVDHFWNNAMWRHKDVVWAIFETIPMAFLGTMGAAIVALPLAFLAASNFTALRSLRFATRRVFDFVRGVDGLIWTIILSRAFGPGPLTGSLAILITDSGSFGKMFSEALENIDEKQVEGLKSTGANSVQRARFGVIPQLVPVLLSQVLYFLESNTRSATVIGAIVGGGIGLMLTQAITTQKDWEEVSYYIVLIVLMVMLMDTVSGWLRGLLIKGDQGR